MKKKISPNDCNEMFEDRLKNLTMKEIGIELKHFEIRYALLIWQDKIYIHLINNLLEFL